MYGGTRNKIRKEKKKTPQIMQSSQNPTQTIVKTHKAFCRPREPSLELTAPVSVLAIPTNHGPALR